MDDAQGGYLVTKYLLELGHKKIKGFFKADDMQGLERHKGYVKALQESGIAYDPDDVVWFHTEDRKVKPALMAKEMVQSGQLPDGIVCYNDQIAVQVMEELEKMGVRIPDDISITGYDNSLYAQRGSGITTIAHPQEKLGEMAAELILEKINGVPEEETRTVQRYSDHLHLGAEQTAHLRRAANRHPRLPVAQTPHPDLGAQRLHAAADRELPAPRNQVYQNQVCDPASDADAAVRVLRQPAAVHQGALPPLPRKQHARPLGFFGSPGADLLPAEVGLRTELQPKRLKIPKNPVLTTTPNPSLRFRGFTKQCCNLISYGVVFL